MQELLTHISPSVASHWVDGILVCLFVFYAIEGFFTGAVYALFDLLKFVVSFIGGLFLYSLVGGLLISTFHMPKGYANALGFFLAAFCLELILHFFLRKVIKKANSFILNLEPIYQKMNNILGILPGVLSATVLSLFIVTLLVSLPVSPFLKHAITDSTLGGFFVDRSQNLDKNIAAVFGGAADETLNFLTVEPESNASVALGFTTSKGTVDTTAEQEMLTMVNTEREKRGIAPLTMDTALQHLARSYAQEMLSKGYFSHYSPEGLSPFDRMNNAGIQYSYAGENLAFSANVQLAMQGLMNSEGHRENILSVHYKKVGIGVVNAGIYGEMFVQEFTD